MAINIRTLCLGILSIKEASGYEIKKELEVGKFSHFVDASFGSIYPALTQMNVEGMLSVRAEEQSGRPDKKVYAITETGKAALAKSLSVMPSRDKFKSEFLFEMLFQEILSQDHVDLVIEKQHADLSEDLARIEQKRALKGGNSLGEGPKFVMGYGECILRAAVNFLEAQCPRLKKSKNKATE